MSEDDRIVLHKKCWPLYILIILNIKDQQQQHNNSKEKISRTQNLIPEINVYKKRRMSCDLSNLQETPEIRVYENTQLISLNPQK